MTEPDDVDAEVHALMLALAAAPPLRRAPLLEPGTRIADHLRVERVLGTGGMGVVVLARDLRLDRDVAVKVHGSRSAPEAIERLDREARAMAQLIHPNVAVIHEVGSHDGHLYLAMEYVEGGTARTWLDEAPRSWRDIVALYVQAGRGLAAAHAAQLVHRDFKPDNVLVGVDGRVRVADFGLVRALVSAPHAATANDRVEGRGPEAFARGVPLTGAGTVLGTPAYMAPEQLAGGEAGPAADQYAFCVALFEALHGHRPRDPPARGRPRAVGPAWLQRAIDRGLADDPKDRWPSMAALVDRLERGIAPVSGRRVAAVLGTIAVAAVALAAVIAPKLATSSCDDSEDRIAGVWSDDRRAALAQVFAERGGPNGEDAWRAAEETAQRWIDGWIAARTASCEATRVHGTQTEHLLERSMSCFEQRATTLDALLAAFADATDPSAVSPAMAIDQIPTPAACSDARYLLALVEPPDDAVTAAAVDRARAELARVRAEITTGRIDLAERDAASLREAAEATGYEPLIADAFGQLGVLALQDGRIPESEGLVTKAYFAARRSGHHDLAVDAALVLAAIEVDRVAFPAARTWIELARVELTRGEADPDFEIPLEQRDAQLLEAQGQPEQALLHYRRALAIALELRGEGPTAAWMREDVATALDSAGQRAEAVVAHREAIDALERTRGASTQVLSFAYSNYGLTLAALGRHDEAITAHRRALDLHTALAGPDSLAGFALHLNLGIAFAGAGRFDDARIELDRALELAKERGGGDDEDVALTLGALGYVASRTGDHARALLLHRRALAMQRAILGPDHPTVASSVAQVGDALLRLGRIEEARSAFVESTEIWRRGGNAEHADAAAAWVGLAETEVASREFADAEIHATRVLDGADAIGIEPEVRARAEFALARAIIGVGGYEARARELARTAADALRRDGRDVAADEITSWLASRSHG